MIVIAGILLGALWGGMLARRRKGKPADIAQYAAAYGIIFGIVGMFVTIFVERML
ncbi:apolipoprotein acyltransferase [Actibacterium sp. MT2.3-13A]|uniref:apolipoprotein acyltransferase n=1 Tax=Actibacterium sp. MT2.3-13A TaxID=2828332 RepID=UPI001BAC29EC|nr:apolipoprotein acyltransferase [Actibacterium sp. MT2.3-13A]